MPGKLAGKLIEKSSGGIRWHFVKEDGTDKVMLTLTWTLTNLAGDIINGLEDVNVPTPTAEQTIFMSGDDLQIEDQANMIETRIMTIQATYDPEDATGAKPFKDSREFPLYNLKAVT